MGKYYLTTPIYYPSANLHIGHTYTTVAAGIIKRYREKLGDEVYFVTGTDEHGQKMKDSAKENGLHPKAYADVIVADTKKLWEKLEINYDKFIRTTDDYHIKAVQNIFTKLYEKGEIYKDVYKGSYCIPCESFWAESQLVDGNCPDCNRPVEEWEEESYFFRLSNYTDRILELYEDHPDFLKPESRKNEMINNFLKDGLEDLSVTRSNLDWGIPVPFDEGHVIYVWIDALSCYITALGYETGDEELFDKFWPANVHLVGKEIVRFHSIIWPAILMALDIEIPERIFGHGWILFEDDKMSKSKGNIIYPEPIIELFGIDQFKYFLMREFHFGRDGSFSMKNFLQRSNTDLANDLGNLLSRTTAMIEQYFNSEIPGPEKAEYIDEELKNIAINIADKIEKHMEEFQFSDALEEIWTLIRRTNRYIDETEPWVLAKEDRTRLTDVIYNLSEALRIISVLLDPFMHHTAEEIRRQLGLAEDSTWAEAKEWGLTEAGIKINRGEALFPRIDIEEMLEEFNKLNDALIEERTGSEDIEAKELISFDDFTKLDMRIGKITEVKDHPDADKLYILQIDVDKESRQVVSGVKEYYTEEDLLGKKVVILMNLEPIKLRGVESEGMLLAAEDKNGKLSFLSTLEEVDTGSEIS